MFFYAIYKSPIWKNLSPKNRSIRVFMAGALLYVIFHSFLYSNYLNNIQAINKYKKYIYFVIAIDILVTAFITYRSRSSSISISTQNKFLHPRYNPYPQQYIQQYMQPSVYPRQIQTSHPSLSTMNHIPSSALHTKHIYNLQSSVCGSDDCEAISNPQLTSGIVRNDSNVFIKKNNQINKSIPCCDLPIYESKKEKIPIYKSNKDNNNNNKDANKDTNKDTSKVVINLPPFLSEHSKNNK
uniref:Uncharacterized protein n=1 Tax=Mimivirus LCMiAC01 TaxID=2506608 RepID=A0A481YYX9_9VIRU|nr:MAG: hypothetical protein LCMiAC01_01300 [Mimivirus LCMiAC01]